jgi:hypothetical protein
VDWEQQGFRGTLAICVSIGSKLFTNLMARCDNIAVAMAARGFRGPQQHVLYPTAPAGEGFAGSAPRARLRLLVDCALVLSLLAFAMAGSVLV